jgi:glycosyltransferase involved in cell wall biosynthesis
MTLAAEHASRTDATQDADQRLAATTRLKANFAQFESEVAKAEAHLKAGRFEDAALSVTLASAHATQKHCGVFASERVERILRAISDTLPDRAAALPRKKDLKDVRRILHVATELTTVGGLTRMMTRWINTDASRENSVALTRFRGVFPQQLDEAVARSGGKVHRLNTRIGSVRNWALDLRKLARGYDLVVMHIHCEDTVPVIAFAASETLPPVLLLNHADHIFWVGPSVCHAVLNLREAAADITVNRRGVAPERSLMLPTLIDPPSRKMSREEARAKLGIDADATAMISVARGAKYRPIKGVTYASRFVDVLKANPKARLFVVGSGSPDDWKPAQDQVPGRITGLPEQPDPSAYFEAADIYVDSYPFSSSTSLMEAAGYGLPLLTLFVAPDEARLVGINHLGLEGGLVQARTTQQWEATLTRMIRDPAFRMAQSEAATRAVAIAQPTEWLNWLERAYQQALDLPPLPPLSGPMPGNPDTPRFGEPDIRHEDMYGSHTPLDEIAKDHIGAFALPTRIRLVSQLQSEGKISGARQALRLLVPEWLKRRLKRAGRH